MLRSPRVRALVRSVLESAADRHAAAEKAAQGLHLDLPSAVVAEIRWAFTPPRVWLAGVVANLFLALIWLLVQPLHPHHHHHDWVVLVGTYFASFILADVTTTNMLGIDHIRVRTALRDGVSLLRILIVKNLALVAIVGIPTLLIAMAMTLWMETPARLAVTIPNVAVPIVSWLGVGNLVSVLLPVGDMPLITRWRQRHDRRRTARWVVHLVLPYALYYVADPVGGVEHKLLWRQVPHAIAPILGRESRSFIHIGIAFGVWVVTTALAYLFFSGRGIHTAEDEAEQPRSPARLRS
ncbi:MAG TPA: hypothetical protein VFB19_18930 [Mycobacterium sp.]|nr:hypothetical protein [Mycobacterium sp.]